MEIDVKNLTGSIQLRAGHSLVLGHMPKSITPELMANKLNNHPTAIVEKFGLFDYASPNYATYYPEVSADDLDPKDEEFIEPLFRMLSETIVSKGAPIDFSKKGVLKASMQKLLGQTVNIDHEMAIGNAIGAVSEVFWQESYKDSSGVTVPAGINARLKIDGKSNPRIVRGIMMKPPSIHSNSVTVRFKWEPSHEFEDNGEFYRRIGTYDKDGQLIRLVVTEVLSYHETSLVSHGADVFAQKIDEDSGKIINPGYAGDNYSFSADKPYSGTCLFDYKDPATMLSLDGSIPEEHNYNNDSNPKKENHMKDLLEQLSEQLGLTEGELTQENAAEKVKEALEAKSTEVTNLTNEKTQLETDKAELEGELETQKGEVTRLEGELETANTNKDAVENFTTQTKEDAVRFYKLVKGDNAEDSMIELINNSDLKGAQALLEQFEGEAEGKFEAKCNSCGSNDVSRFSAKTPDIDDGEGDEDNKSFEQKKTKEEARKSFKEKRRKKSRLFNDKKQ